ncbi:MAG: DUF4954 family protein [Spirochaetia bacterium]
MDDSTFRSKHIKVVTYTQRIKKEIEDQEFRQLTKAEIEKLETNGCSADNWTFILVAKDFSPQKVRETIFFGSCKIGSFTEEESGNPYFPPGIYRSIIRDSIIGNNTSIVNSGPIIQAVINDNASLVNCSSVLCTGPSSYSAGKEISIGSETGGREVCFFPDMHWQEMKAYAVNRNDTQVISDYRKKAEKVQHTFKWDKTVIGANAMVINCSLLKNSWIFPFTRVEGAGEIINSLIISDKENQTQVQTGAVIRSSILQWGCTADTYAVVEDSLLYEYSYADRHGKVISSIIGPNTGVAEGECTSSLLGPFVGFHHQSLCIACIWPEGKGNIGYGANVGSNHTGKLPDQELYSGEGLFYGLGVNIKYPCDYTNAQYTIIATGVTTLPQQVSMPFSLISTPTQTPQGLSPAINEIVPAWVLSNNLYSILRNQWKFKRRDKSLAADLDYSPFSKSALSAMDAAHTSLKQTEGKEVYTSVDIPELGKNFCTNKSRIAAIETYIFFIRYALLELLTNWYKTGGNLMSPQGLHEAGAQCFGDNCLLYRLTQSYLEDVSFQEAIDIFSAQKKTILQMVINSKKRDTERGERIQRDYSDIHADIEKDDFIQSLKSTLLE